MIRLGVCTGMENAGLLAGLGFDYIEPALNGIAAMEETFARGKAEIAWAGIACEAFNCMFPGELKLTGEEVDPSAIENCLSFAYDRAARLGARTVVFGSGGSRRVPDGFSHAQAWRQIKEFLILADSSAARYGLTVAIEPLDRGECNILNYVSEATALAALVDLPRIAVLADTYHMARCGEPLTALAQTGGLLLHIHLAEPTKRRFPKAGDGQDYGALGCASPES